VTLENIYCIIYNKRFYLIHAREILFGTFSEIFVLLNILRISPGNKEKDEKRRGILRCYFLGVNEKFPVTQQQHQCFVKMSTLVIEMPCSEL
jgi:hypothetical protein